MTCLVENIIGPLKILSDKMFTLLIYSRDLRKGLDRLKIARKMPTKREAQMRGYLLLFVTKIIIFPMSCDVCIIIIAS